MLPTFKFAAMKADLDRFQPKSVQWMNREFSFLRKGVPGDAQNHVTKEQRHEFAKRLREHDPLTKALDGICQEQVREQVQALLQSVAS